MCRNLPLQVVKYYLGERRAKITTILEQIKLEEY